MRLAAAGVAGAEVGLYLVAIGVIGPDGALAGAVVGVLVKVVLVDERQDVEDQRAVRFGVGERSHGRRQLAAVGVGAVDCGEADLLEVVGALRAGGGLTHLLH